METSLIALKNADKYREIIDKTFDMKPEECQSLTIAYIIAKAYEKESAFSQSLKWYKRNFELNESDETLGMVVGVALAIANYSVVSEMLEKAIELQYDYYYSAAKYELAFRTQQGIDAEIEALEKFLDIQEEESYMLRLANLYVVSGLEKEAGRLCKKMRRLFINGKSVEYAEELLQAIKDGSAKEYVLKNPWKENYVFKHISFDLTVPPMVDKEIKLEQPQTVIIEEKETVESNVQADKATEGKNGGIAAMIAKLENLGGAHKKEEKIEKKDKKEKIAPIVEKNLEGIVGMQELRSTMNSMFNMMQTSKKRIGFNAILKDNIKIVGPDGCGKTTAAMAAARVMAQIGIISKDDPVITDYYSLVGSSAEETHDNIQELFENSEKACILIDNIHEFDDSGAYSLGLDAIDQLVKAYYAAEEKIPLIITGSEKEVEELFLKKRRLADLFNLPSIVLGKYSIEELVEIANKLAEEKGLIIEDEASGLIATKMEHMSQQPDFKYSRDLDKILNEAYIRQLARISRIRRPAENDYYLLKSEDFEVGEALETVEELLEQLNRLTGLTEVKKQVNKIVNQVTVQKMREESGIKAGQGHGTLHLVFLGNAGTGKTTVARIIGKIYKRLGVLPTGQLVECGRKDLVSQYVGATAQKVADKVKEAMGGILFIDEAYSLCKDDNDTFGKEAIDALLADIENHRDNLMVILAGYSNDMNKFMDQNQGLRSRMPTNILFEDYSTEEMVSIFKMYVKDNGLVLDAGLDDELYGLLDSEKKKKDFGNARGVRAVFEKVVLNQDNRLGEMDPSEISKNDFLIIRREDFEIKQDESKPRKSVDEYLEELNALTGLHSVKERINKIISTVRVNKAMEAAGLQQQGFGTLHMVFKGNAGTGKTTVARMLGNIYRELGVLSSGHVVECDRSKLVAGYTGQTAPMVKAKVQEALGGILFIDEAYTLASDSFGKEAIDTLVADIENYRKELMVIIAGYSDDMDEFLQKNQGLKSRFPNEIIFEDYTADEMLSIFKGMVKSRKLILADGMDERIKKMIMLSAKEADFGNARGIRNIVDKVTEQRSLRLAEIVQSGKELTQEELCTIVEEDIQIEAEVGRKSVDEYLAELNALIGLQSVKEKINKIISTVRVNKAMEAAGLQQQGFGTLHMVFKGNAGTGKTTVARKIGNIYRELGVLSSGHVVECDRSMLVAGYTGQTALKVKEKVKEALGGILFIDEAYTLASDSFGKEAIDTLVADIENYRNSLMVIVAGYSDDMDMFMSQNQGLSSRFPHEIIFEDYSPEELLSIFKYECKSRGLNLCDEMDDLLVDMISLYSKDANFGNARGIRNLTDKVCEQRNVRLMGIYNSGSEPTKEELKRIEREDIEVFLK